MWPVEVCYILPRVDRAACLIVSLRRRVTTCSVALYNFRFPAICAVEMVLQC